MAKEKGGLYTVRANASLLEGDAGRTAPVKILWNGCVPPKVCFLESLVGKSAYHGASKKEGLLDG